MEYRYLTGTGLKVSRVTLGTMTFGGQVSAPEASEIMGKAVDAGINLFDTADVYCGGETERIIGGFLRENRSKVLVATKGSMPMGDGVNDWGSSRQHLMKALEDSLRRLQTDHVDIYYIHHPDRNTPMEETLQTLDSMVRSGKVRYFGFSNYPAWEACDMQWIAKMNGFVRPVVSQNVYNMITRNLDDEMAWFLKQHKVGLVVYNPLAGGLLTGKYSRNDAAEGTRFSSELYRNRYWNEKNFDAIDRLKSIAEGAGMSVMELALRWCVSREIVDSMIMGFSKLSHMEQNLLAVEKGGLSVDILEACDRVWKSLKGDVFEYFTPPGGSAGIANFGVLK